MHVLIAPNAFKGSLSAVAAAQCVAEGLEGSNLSCTFSLFPIADGGDDTASLLVRNKQGRLVTTGVHDPLGRPVKASFGWVEQEQLAVIGMSDASGLRLLKKEELDPLHADTFGTGELIKAALNKGAKKILIGAGGSATVDGGTGLLRALGVRLLDGEGRAITALPKNLTALSHIDLEGIDKRILRTEIVVLCDVKNTLLGKEGAAPVFGPQKGAGGKEVIILEEGLRQWNDRTVQAVDQDMSALPYGGAAGGVSAALAAYGKARLVSGIEFFLEESHFEDLLQKADLVITGEGRIDEQTLEGKGPLGIARRAKKRNIPVIGMAGEVPRRPTPALQYYFKALIAINPPGASLEDALKNTGKNLTTAAHALGDRLAGR